MMEANPGCYMLIKHAGPFLSALAIYHEVAAGRQQSWTPCTNDTKSVLMSLFKHQGSKPQESKDLFIKYSC